MSEKGYKYWSVLLNDKFDTEQELLDAEKAFKEKEAEKKEKELTISKQKKLLADKIAKCDEDIDAALNNLTEVKKECAKILEDSNKVVEEKLNAAQKFLSDARNAKYNNIAEFNDKFGVYRVNYTGDKAKQEIKRFDNDFQSLWNSVLRDFLW